MCASPLASSQPGAPYTYRASESQVLTTWPRVVNKNIVRSLEALKAETDQGVEYPMSCMLGAAHPTHLPVALSPVCTRSVPLSLSHHTFAYCPAVHGHIDRSFGKTTLSWTIAIGLVADSVLGLPWAARFIDGQDVHDLKEEQTDEAFDEDNQLAAPSDLGRQQSYAHKFRNALHGQAVFVVVVRTHHAVTQDRARVVHLCLVSLGLPHPPTTPAPRSRSPLSLTQTVARQCMPT